MGEWNQGLNHNEKSLIDLLIRLNLVTQAQVTDALEIQCRQSQAQRQSLETLLLDMEVIKDIDLLQAKQLLNLDSTTQSRNRVDELKDWHSKSANSTVVDSKLESSTQITAEQESPQMELSLDDLARSMDRLGFNSPAKSQPGTNMPDLETTLDRLGFTNKKTETPTNKSVHDLASSLEQLGFETNSSPDAVTAFQAEDLQALFVSEPTRSQAPNVANDFESALDLMGFAGSNDDAQPNQVMNQLETLFNSPSPEPSQQVNSAPPSSQSDFESALQLLGFDPEPVAMPPAATTTQVDQDFEDALEMLGFADPAQDTTPPLPPISELDSALDLLNRPPMMDSHPQVPQMSQAPVVPVVTPAPPPATPAPPPPPISQAAPVTPVQPPISQAAPVTPAPMSPPAPQQGMRAAGAFASRNMAQQGGGSWATASPQKIITSQIPPQAAQAIRSIDKPLPKSPLGEILIKNNQLEEWQLTHALCIQRDAPQTTPKLGTLLVQLGYANAKDVEKALQSQK